MSLDMKEVTLPDRDVELAKESSRAVARNIEPNSELVLKIVKDGQEEIVLPEIAARLLLDMLTSMADGKPVALLPMDAELTTAQAAKLLGVSRPHLVNKILDAGKLAFHKVGSHRKIQVSDLHEYKTAEETRRRSLLDELVEDAQEHELGY